MTASSSSPCAPHLAGTSAEPPQTADESPDAVSLILITYNREADIRASLASLAPHAHTVHEIIVVNNASTDGTAATLGEFEARLPNLRVIHAEANLGVAGGRNRGMRAARGGILVFLDDDAEFLDADFSARIIARFAREPRLGALALRIVDGRGAMRPHEFPHPDKARARDREFPVAYFTGAGHALRREALREVGLYPEEFFYSQEETFLSAALIEGGYRITYFPEVTVRHWQSNAGRFTTARKWSLLLRNTLLMNHRFLPLFPYLWSFFVWSGKVVILSRDFRVVRDALREYHRLRELPVFRRRPLKGAAFAYLRRHGGRVWW